jgi:ribosomal protein S27E
MTNKVVNLSDHRPHSTAYVACMSCAHDWVAVFPESALPLECPSCGVLEGEPVQTQSSEWFKRFMAGPDANKRTLVMLNANRMGL